MIGASVYAMASSSLWRAIDLFDMFKLSEALIVSSAVTVAAGSSAVTKPAEHVAGPNCPTQSRFQQDLGVQIHGLHLDRFPAEPKKTSQLSMARNAIDIKNIKGGGR